MPLLAGLARDARRAFEPKPGTGNGYAGGRNESILYNLLGAQTKSGKVVTEDAALGLSAYYRGIAIRSNIPGTLPMHAYRKASDGRRQQVDDEYPWIRKPNREVSRPVFWVTVFAHLSSWNNAFIYVVPKDRTKPGSPQNVGELYPLEPKRVRWGRDAAGDKVYAIDGDQPARSWNDPKPGPGPRLVHIPGWGTDGMGGRAAWMLARQSLGIGIAAEDKAATYFDKDTAPVNGYLSSDQELSADQCQELSEAWDDGADLGTRVMAKGTKWITTDIDPEKLQLFQTRGYTVAEAARITGVPEHLLGSHDKQSSWGTGLAEQNRGLLTFTIGPDIVTVEVTISDALMATSDYMKLSTEGLMRGSNVEQATYLAILRQNLIINADEWRELMDMEPLPNGQGQEYVNPNTTKNGAGPGAAAATDGNGTAQPAA